MRSHDPSPPPEGTRRGMHMNERDEVMASLLKKKSAIRKEVHGMNWDKDKAMVFNNKKQYDYLSFEKICKQIAPLFEAHGLEFTASDIELSAEAPVGNMVQHWVVKTEFTLWDVDTGASQSACSYGEAADSGDKGINKAKTCALKRWFLDTFQLVEGGEDPDDYGPSGTQSSTVVAPESASRAAPASAVKPGGAPTTSKTEQKYEPTAPQKKAIENIVAKYKEKAEKGEIDAMVFNTMSFACAEIKSSKDAVEFITKYRV